MKRLSDRQLSGFTIIEVMIVLSIAGLILVIVFLAVPPLQRNYRNYRRKQAVAYVIAQVQDYINTYGYPPLDNQGHDNRTAFDAGLQSEGPTKGYTIRYSDTGGSHKYPFNLADPSTAMDEISIEPAHWCNTNAGLNPGDTDYPIKTSGNNDMDYTQYVVWTQLEKFPVFCLDSRQ